MKARRSQAVAMPTKRRVKRMQKTFMDSAVVLEGSGEFGFCFCDCGDGGCDDDDAWGKEESGGSGMVGFVMVVKVVVRMLASVFVVMVVGKESMIEAVAIGVSLVEMMVDLLLEKTMSLTAWPRSSIAAELVAGGAMRKNMVGVCSGGGQPVTWFVWEGMG